MRRILRSRGWRLIAGEYPGGSDHELYALCVVDPQIARDQSPDPRRHSIGELIPDIVALRDCRLLIGEAKCRYSKADYEKLDQLTSKRLADLNEALRKFAIERRVSELL